MQNINFFFQKEEDACAQRLVCVYIYIVLLCIHYYAIFLGGQDICLCSGENIHLFIR